VKQKYRATNFNMSYAELSGICRQKANTIMRDIAEFERFNISAEEIIEYKESVKEFDNMQIDQELLGLVTAVTHQKGKLAEQVRSRIKELSIFIKQYVGIKSSVYQSRIIKDMSRMTDLQLYRMANGVIRIARRIDNSSASAIEGIILELETTNNLFDKIIEEKATMAENRNIATDKRIEAANQLYEKLSNYCEIGRVIWYETHEAKYNDYIIYG